MDLHESPSIPWWSSPKPRGPYFGERGRLMEGEQSGPVVLRKPTPSRPQASLPKRSSADSLSLMTGFGGGGGAGTGDHESDRSFTNMLAGAMASPTSDDGREEGTNLGPRALGSGGGSFAERLAARGAANKELELGGIVGSGGPPSNLQPKVMPPSRISMPQASYQLTIPPGLSPGQLLESPVFLTTAQQAEPSPTTGTFPLPPFLSGEPPNDRGNDQASPGFVFKPFPKPVSRNPLSPLAGMVQQPFGQSHSLSHPQVQSGGQPGVSGMMSSSMSLSGQGGNMNSGPPVAVALSMPPIQSSRQQQPEAVQARSPEQEPPVTVSAPFIERPSEDGYNWRKYGQKQVKGSEYPRSYYKCTNANCPMKKKVERSHDGQVTEIVYKGEHNHLKPQPTRRLAVAAAHLISDSGAGDRADGDGKEWGGFQTGARAGEGGAGFFGVKGERGGDDPSSSVRSRTLGLSLGPNGTVEPSTPSSSDDGSKSATEDGDDDEPDSKRRKKEKRIARELQPAPRTIREPRVVVQTTSDVDILDDGYRWRKYGQKVVKGNPHPRSYYKCTYLSCPVRKHVERASNDPKAVITTYEGKHNHDVPQARNSSHDNAGLGGGGNGPGPSQGGASSIPPAGPTYPQPDRYGRKASVFSRLLDDGSNKGDPGASETDLGMGVGVGQGMRNMDGINNHNHPAGNGGPPHSNISMNLSASLGGPRPIMDPYSGGPGMQDSGLRPKQEEDDSHSNGLQPNIYAQRLVLGP